MAASRTPRRAAPVSADTLRPPARTASRSWPPRSVPTGLRRSGSGASGGRWVSYSAKTVRQSLPTISAATRGAVLARARHAVVQIKPFPHRRPHFNRCNVTFPKCLFQIGLQIILSFLHCHPFASGRACPARGLPSVRFARLRAAHAAPTCATHFSFSPSPPLHRVPHRVNVVVVHVGVAGSTSPVRGSRSILVLTELRRRGRAAHRINDDCRQPRSHFMLSARCRGPSGLRGRAARRRGSRRRISARRRPPSAGRPCLRRAPASSSAVSRFGVRLRVSSSKITSTRRAAS